ncbi:MAG: YkgJ family cysteine cluster protein [Myxococcota bacterium]
MARPIESVYQDPLDLIWLRCARECGFEVERTGDVYASYDPAARRLRIATPAAFDADDSLAQMLLHELCHALVAGPEGLARLDFGLENVDDRDLVFEHATHRLQAHLADRYGLRALFAVTTDWRPYWDRLPRDPLAASADDDPAVPLARAARARADLDPWAAALRKAFVATQAMADLVRAEAPDGSLWKKVSARVHERHPLGPHLGPAGEKCGSCAWLTESDGPEGKRALRCEMHRSGTAPPPKARPEWSACALWEPRLDDACGDCGACCRQAFHLVPVGPTEPLVSARPDLVVHDPQGHSPYYVPRPGGFCVALVAPRAPFRCGVYEERPQSCRDFAVGSRNCLEARRRVGLSGRP